MSSLGLVGLIAKAALSGAIRAASASVAQDLIDECRRQKPELTLDQEGRLRQLLGEGQGGFWEYAWAKLRPMDRRGVLLCGPSGAGKTQLYNYLVSDSREPPTRSTAEITKQKVRESSRVFRFWDSPGGLHQLGVMPKLEAQLITGARIVVLMTAHGYLHQPGVPWLLYQETRRRAASLAEFLETRRQSELAWLQAAAGIQEVPPAKKAECLFVVTNKQDQWNDEKDQVERRVEQGELRPWLDTFAKKVCRTNVVPTFCYLACDYDNFAGQQPSAKFSRSESLVSLIVFRARLRAQLLEFG